MNSHSFNLTMQRVMDEFEAAYPLAGMAAVTAKYQGAEEDKRKYQLIMDIMGNNGLGWAPEGKETDEVRVRKPFLAIYAHTIAGGTSEVQLNIIAKRVSGLPD